MKVGKHMEYSRNFVNNIRSSEFNERAKGIANWIEENKDKEEGAKDPNAYEMTNVFCLQVNMLLKEKTLI